MSKITKELQDIAGDEALGTNKYKKEVSEIHNNSRLAERADDKVKPRLTHEMLRARRVGILPKIVNPDPNYRYKWFSLDQVSGNELSEALSMGYYSLVKTHELPEMTLFMKNTTKVDSGLYQDCIRVREMILAKIHKDDWQTIMEHNHHIRPSEGESDIKSNLNAMISAGGRGVSRVREDVLQSPNSNEGGYDHNNDRNNDVPYAIQTGMDNYVTKVKPNFD